MMRVYRGVGRLRRCLVTGAVLIIVVLSFLYLYVINDVASLHQTSLPLYDQVRVKLIV